jgi:hypothetical protein
MMIKRLIAISTIKDIPTALIALVTVVFLLRTKRDKERQLI